MSAVTIAFIIGLMVQVTKIVDLIFTEKQKSVIQDKVETFTLWLEDVKPIAYFRYAFEMRFIRIILTVFCAYIFYNVYLFLNIFFTNEELLEHNYHWYVLALLVPTYLGLRFYGKKAIAWMTKAGFWNFGIRWLLVSIHTFFVLYILIFLNNEFGESEYFDIFFYTYVILFLLSGYFGTSFAISLYGAAVIVYRAILLLFHFLIKGASFILWRIVQYNKGAVAAITLLITFALGVAEVVMKMKK